MAFSETDDDNKYYRGNRNLFGQNAEHSYSQEELEEFIKCSKDPIYFIKNYVKIVHVDHGLVPFALYDYQQKMVNTFHNNRNTICLSTRQSGKSTTCGGYYLWCMIFKERTSIAILANKEMIAIELLGRIKESLEHLPEFLKPKIKTWKETSFELTNGSKVIAAATSANAIRGKSISILHIDEFAFIAPNIAEEFFASVWPTISSGKKTKTIIVSTPNGYNKFHDMWKKAEQKKNSFVPIRVDWQEVPGRDQAWKEQTIADLGSQQKFDQEYGNNFLGSSNTLIPAEHIERMEAEDPIESTETVKIYKHEEPGRHYVLVADVAEGLGLDFSAFTIFDVTEYPITIAAIYKDNKISPLLYPTIIDRLARKYNFANVLVEKNNIGGQVTTILQHDLDYPNLVGFDYHSYDVGIKTSRKVKALGCEILKNMIENQKVVINDVSMISELSTFIRVKQSYKADVGRNDDLTMTLVLMAWFTQTDEFKYITDIDLRKEMLAKRQKEIDEDVVPAGFFISDAYKEFEVEESLISLLNSGFFD